MLYISYSGYYEESGAGTIQLTKMFQFLEESNFIYCNLFGCNDYKYKLGATDIYLKQYLCLFNAIKAISVKNAPYHGGQSIITGIETAVLQRMTHNNAVIVNGEIYHSKLTD